MADVVLAVRNGAPVLVKDVGDVTIGSAPRLGQFGYNEQNDAVEGVIMMRTGEQAQTVLKRGGGEDRGAEPDGASEGCEDPPVLRPQRAHQAHDSNRRRTTCCEGSSSLVVVLIFFLYDLRSGMIVADR